MSQVGTGVADVGADRDGDPRATAADPFMIAEGPAAPLAADPIVDAGG